MKKEEECPKCKKHRGLFYHHSMWCLDCIVEDN